LTAVAARTTMAAPTMLADMAVFGAPSAKLWKALAVIAADLHPAIAKIPGVIPDISKRSCVLCSLTARDFLQRIGIDAIVAPVVTVLWADQDGKQLHSAGIGVPGEERRSDRRNWNGHMIVIVPRERLLIDTTLYQINRPAWDDLPGMIVAPIGLDKPAKLWGLDVLAALQAEGSDGYVFSMTWLANPTNNAWRNGRDASRNHRRAIVKKLVREFGPWSDK